MVRTAIAAVAFGAWIIGPAPAIAAPASKAAPAISDVSSQSRLRVYPGRLLYRECDVRLVRVTRPDGTFIVPRQRCWWVRG